MGGPHGGFRGGHPGMGPGGMGGSGTNVGRGIFGFMFHPHARGNDGSGGEEPKKPGLLDKIGQALADILGY